MNKKRFIIVVIIILLFTMGLGATAYIQNNSQNSYPNMGAGDEVCADDVANKDKNTEKNKTKPAKPKKIKLGFKVGQRIPNLKLHTSDNKEESLYDLIEGKEKFVLNFSADWCSDSQREKDKLEKVYPDLEKNNIGVAVVYVNLSKDDPNKTTSIKQIKQYLEDSNFSFPTFIDMNDELLNKLDISSVPTNIILDKNGIIKGHTEEIDMDNLLLENQEEFRK